MAKNMAGQTDWQKIAKFSLSSHLPGGRRPFRQPFLGRFWFSHSVADQPSRNSGYTTQEPLTAPSLHGPFSRGFSRGRTAQQGIRGNGPLRSENEPLRIKEGKRPTMVNGLFSCTPPCWKTAPLKGPTKEAVNPRF